VPSTVADWIRLIGSGAILISAFAPILNVPVVGAVTYFNGNSDSSKIFVAGAGIARTPFQSPLVVTREVRVLLAIFGLRNYRSSGQRR
jgi:hypothetical protein